MKTYWGAFVVAVLTAGLCAAPGAAATGDQVTYVVEADGPLISVDYSDGTNQMVSDTSLPSAWAQNITSQEANQLYSVSAQTKGTQVSCRIVINGRLADSQTATGAGKKSACSAT